jgi:hypothetical protein
LPCPLSPASVAAARRLSTHSLRVQKRPSGRGRAGCALDSRRRHRGTAGTRGQGASRFREWRTAGAATERGRASGRERARAGGGWRQSRLAPRASRAFRQSPSVRACLRPSVRPCRVGAPSTPPHGRRRLVATNVDRDQPESPVGYTFEAGTRPLYVRHSRLAINERRQRLSARQSHAASAVGATITAAGSALTVTRSRTSCGVACSPRSENNSRNSLRRRYAVRSASFQ